MSRDLVALRWPTGQGIRSREGYAIALRNIVADAFSIDGGKAKYDAHGPGRQIWLERVHAIKLRDLTPAVVQKWKRDFRPHR